VARWARPVLMVEDLMEMMFLELRQISSALAVVV
jgi:hypothetical protein